MYTIRGYELTDKKVVTGLWKECLPADPEAFRERVFLDARSCASMNLVACDGKRVVGFISAADYFSARPSGCGGRIYVLFVSSSARRNGIGMGLLSAVERQVRTRQGRLVRVGGDGPELCPGVEKDQQSEAMSFFQAMGYAEYAEAAAMSMNLASWTMSDADREAVRTLKHNGFRFEWYQEPFCVPLLEFAEQHCPQVWADVVRRAIVREEAEKVLLLALDQQNRVVGYCQRGSDGVPSHIGPLGIDPRLRGRRIGSVLLSLMMVDIVQSGISDVSLGWVVANPELRCFYEKRGMHVIHRYSSLCKTLV